MFILLIFLQTLRDQAGVKPGPRPPLDVCTPAGVAKMLIRDTDKLSSKDLREGTGDVLSANLLLYLVNLSYFKFL